jgi:hypothetical protein
MGPGDLLEAAPDRRRDPDRQIRGPCATAGHRGPPATHLSDGLLGDLLGELSGQATPVGGVELLFVEIDVGSDWADLDGAVSDLALGGHGFFLR